MKSYTDIKQSKKLAEILNKQTADMWYQYIGASYEKGSEKPLYFPMIIRDSKTEDDIPCWSLAALLSVISEYTLQTTADGKVFVVCESKVSESKKLRISDDYDNPVDACFEMVVKLHELKML